MSDGPPPTAKLEKQIRVLQRKLERSEWHRIDLENQHDRDQHLYRRLQADLEAARRDAEIEAALERIRAQSLKMEHSSELVATSSVFHEQLLALGVPTEFSYVWLPDEAAGKHQFWATWTEVHDDELVSRSRAVTYDLDREEPYTAACFAAWESDESLFVDFIPPADVPGFFATWAELLGPADDLKAEHFPDGIHYAEGYMQYGCFGINIRRAPTPEEREVIGRFAVEFERAYARFLDLRRAEAQAREAVIEAALERVRSRTMAMQSSDELGELSHELVKQLRAVGVETWHCAFHIYDEGRESSTEWGANADGHYPRYSIPRVGVFERYHEIGQSGVDLHVEEIGPERCAEHYDALCRVPGAGDVLLGLKASGVAFPEVQVDHVAYFRYGYLMFITFEPVPEAHDVFRRFARAFEQTYTRFLDLKQAEAQAREAEIEAALERVRSRTMAMQKSDELRDIIQVVRDHIAKLDIHADHAGFIMDYQDRDDMHIWLTDEHEVPSEIVIPYFDTPHWNSFLEAKSRGGGSFTNDLDFDEKNAFYEQLFEWIPGVPEATKDYYLGCPGLSISTVLLENVGLYMENFSARPYTDDENAILLRFGRVFQQAYTRYLDLEQAEARAREAQIEAAMERVRSRALAMTASDELLDVVFKIHHEFAGLGLPCAQFWQTRYTPEVYQKALTGVGGGKLAAIMELPRDFTSNPALAEWERGDEKIGVFKFDADAACSYLRHMIAKGHFHEVDPEGITEDMVRAHGGFTFVQARTSHGEIGYTLWGETEPSEEARDVLIRFTSAFDLAYRRFEDLQQAERQAALDRVRAEIASTLRSDAQVTAATFTPLAAEIRTLFGRSDLRLGLATLQADGGLNVRPGRPLWNSLVIRDALGAGGLDLRGTPYETAMNGAEALAVADIHEHGSIGEPLRGVLLEHDVRSLALQPLRTADRTVGLLELSSSEPGAVGPATLSTLTALESTFALAVTQNLEGFEASVESAIQQAYTAIHPSVRWRFRDAAIELLERGEETAEPEPVVFESVYPLYGAADIRSSTHHRNEAVRHDLLARLGRARDALAAVHGVIPLTILDELGLRVRRRIERYESAWNAGDEATAHRFLADEVEPVLERMTVGRPDLLPALETYRASDGSCAPLRSDAYEASRRAINRAVSDVLLAEEAEAQGLFPHYLELTRTDGVEHTIYIGASVAPDRPFDLAYVENLRLRQLLTACAVAREVRRLGETLPMPLAIAQLVVVQHDPITLRFRPDEKRFDVDSPSGVRFELLKKRLDKACVAGTDERITQPDRIAVVYSTEAEEAEYRRYTDYLAAQGHIEPDPERLEVEDLPGAAGLEALRLSVSPG